VTAQPAPAGAGLSERELESAAPRVVLWPAVGAAAARPVVVGWIVGVEALVKEPHEEDDQGTDIEGSEAHHEDPPLGAHHIGS